MASVKRKPQRPSVKVACAMCGNKFDIKPSRLANSQNNRLFCSRACSGAYRKAHLQNNATCHYCGREFHRVPSELSRRHVTNHYCCRQCYEKARQEGLADKRRPVGRGGAHESRCARCGAIFYLKPSILNSDHRHYCSRECKRLDQITTGSYVPRQYMKDRQDRCQICGLDDPDILVIHHKDSNPRHNRLENLMVVCPNCHARIHKGLVKV
jgi:5-methylcytosine-specific restriction endonuclease McrA